MDRGPTVVLSLLDDVDLVATAWSIETAWSMFGLEHQVRTRLPVHALRVSMTVRPNLGPRVLLAHERIVLRHSAVVVQTKRLAGERIELLGQLAMRCVSGRDVEFSIRTKLHATTSMKLRRRQIFDDHFTIDEPLGRLAITHDAHFRPPTRIRIRQVNKMIAAELRVQRDTHQTSLSGRLDIRNDKQRFRIQRALLHHAYPSRTLGEDHPAVRRPDDGPRNLEPACNFFDFEICI